MKRAEYIPFRTTVEQLERLNRLVEEYGITKSWIIFYCVRESLDTLDHAKLLNAAYADPRSRVGYWHEMRKGKREPSC